MELALPIIIFLGIPLLMLFLFKSNVGIMFFAACAGLVLLLNLDPVVVTTAGSVVPVSEGEAYVRLAVVMLSIVFAGLIFRETVKGLSLLLNTFIALLLALMLWLTMPAATGVSWLITSIDSQYWQSLNDFKSLIIAIGFALSLIVVLTGHKKPHKKSKH